MSRKEQPIKAVIFDLGRVLVKVDLKQGIHKYVDTTGEDDHSLMENLFDDKIFRDYSGGKSSPETFYRQISARLNLNLDYEQFKKDWCNIFSPMPGMEEIVKKLSGKVALGLLSDSDPLHWRHIKENYDFHNYFKKPTLSFEIGYIKPDPKCYTIAAEHVGFPPENCIFIDDREINVQGAIDAGMQAIQFTSPEALKAELQKRGLF